MEPTLSTPRSQPPLALPLSSRVAVSVHISLTPPRAEDERGARLESEDRRVQRCGAAAELASPRGPQPLGANM